MKKVRLLQFMLSSDHFGHPITTIFNYGLYRQVCRSNKKRELFIL